jgi:hypothetical protein
MLPYVRPGLKIWLDMDHLNDLGRLEEAVSDSAVFIIFLSHGYFRSANCRRELCAAISAGKPIVTVREADTAKGGATLEELKQECRDFFVFGAQGSSPHADGSELGPGSALDAVFGHDLPVVWLREQDFQLASLKLIVARMLQHFPFYLAHPAELAAGLKVTGALGPVCFKYNVKLLVCASNGGARELAHELLTTVAKDMFGGGRGQVVDAEEELTAPDPSNSDRRVLLLYLNVDTFTDEAGLTHRLVKCAIDWDVPVVLFHERDPAAGGCPFLTFFEQTPSELQAPPYLLFDRIAVPLYPHVEHRSVSLRNVLIGAGAVNVANGPHPELVRTLSRGLTFSKLPRQRFGLVHRPPQKI